MEEDGYKGLRLPHLVKEGGNKVCSSLSDGGVKETGISAHEKLLNASVL